MPKRSNDFQKFVLFIEKQLLNTNVKITESALLIDSDGNEREIDILLETNIGEHKIKIAIECRKHKRKGDVMWIDQIKGKYERLSMINKVVAVSAKGFTSGAKTACLSSNLIELITLEEARKVDWESRIKNLTTAKLIYNKFEILNINIHIKDVHLKERIFFPNQDANIYHNGIHKGTIKQYVVDKVNDSFFKSELNDFVKKNESQIKDDHLKFDCTFLAINPPDFYEIKDPNNMCWQFNAITLSLKYMRKVHNEKVDIFRYNNVQIATVHTVKDNYDHSIAIIQEKGKEFKVETLKWQKRTK